MRIGILGGTFDPIHNGHLYLAKKVCQRLRLDKIIFIPTYLPPHKTNFSITSAQHRYNMVKVAIKNINRFEVSSTEIRRKGRSYSIETLKQLRKKYGPKAEIFFIAGSDSLKDLDKWKNLYGILRLCRFVVVKRPHFSMRSGSGNFVAVHINAKDISSTGIRKRLKIGESVAGLVPREVLGYIRRHDLYQGRP